MAKLQLLTTRHAGGGHGSDPITDDNRAICADEILPLLLAACPSFARRLSALEAETRRLIGSTDAWGRGQVAFGPALAHHVVMLIASGRRNELAPTFSLIERFQTHGDHEVGMIVATQLLPALRDQAIRARMDPASLFRPLLGPISALTWDAALYFQAKGCGDAGRLNRRIECLLRALRNVSVDEPEPRTLAGKGNG